ncbi:flagellar hook basal-body protein [Balneolaceae bacterium ANBcel3]|nr:flagellar hook basal-body protein [Balneolaceae bacterium ANBcel3]
MIDRLQAHMQAMQVFSRSQEVTANNLANINTPGFKADTLFHRVLNEEVNGEMVSRTVPMQQVSMAQGELETTGNPFDFAIKGNGFFVIQDDGDLNLTRDGRFNLDADGYLRNERGGYVMGQSGVVHVPEFFLSTDPGGGEPRLEVSKDGTIRLNDEVYDQIRVVGVDDLSSLERKGNSYFTTRNIAELFQDEQSTVMQGYFEKGNVQALHEMTDLMRNMQLFEAQQRALRTTDELLSNAANSLGRF